MLECFPFPEALLSKNQFRSLSVVINGGCFILLQVANHFSEFFFVFAFFSFPLCVSVMSQLFLDIMLLQRLYVIGIFFIIYIFHLLKILL
jgi:hypothetical protein